jgi:hypothetical protein
MLEFCFSYPLLSTCSATSCLCSASSCSVLRNKNSCFVLFIQSIFASVQASVTLLPVIPPCALPSSSPFHSLIHVLSIPAPLNLHQFTISGDSGRLLFSAPYTFDSHLIPCGDSSTGLHNDSNMYVSAENANFAGCIPHP